MKMKLTLSLFVLILLSISFEPGSCFHQYFGLSKTIFKFARSKAEEIIEKGGGHTQCAKDLGHLLTDVVFFKRWAVDMLDACAKPNSGFLEGNNHQIGSFDQCLRIREQKNGSVISGQYCTVVLYPSTKFKTNVNVLVDAIELTKFMGLKTGSHATDVLKMIKTTYGLCLPQSCSIGNLQSLWDYIEHTFRLPVHLTFTDFLCRSADKKIEPYAADFYIYLFFSAFAAMLLASTFYDVLIHQNSKDANVNNYWIAFSLYTNGKKLFSYKNREEENKKQDSDYESQFECINGIKALTAILVVFGHRLLLNMFASSINSIYVFEWKKKVENSFLAGVSFSVDTFFALSGLLLSYGYIKYRMSATGRNKPISFLGFYFYRFLRLSPALFAVILFYIGLFKHLGDGPGWPAASKKLSHSCASTWWATMLFFSNAIDVTYQCVEQSWYLAVDSQLYFISPILLVNLERRPTKTCLTCIGACLLSSLYAFVVTVKNQYGAVYFELNRSYAQHVYTPTIMRMSPWLVGFVFGYVFFKYKHVKINRIVNTMLWTSSLSVMTYLMYVHVEFTTHEYNPVKSGLFNAFARPLWAVALLLITFSCVTGHGGTINKFLSLPIFQIVVKLSYSMYLVHLGVILYFVGSRRHSTYFANINSFHDFFGDLFFTFVISIIWCLSFESPFIAIAKLMFQKREIKSVEKICRKVSRKKNRKAKQKCVVCVCSGEAEEDKFIKKTK